MSDGFWAYGLVMDVEGTEVAEVLDVRGPEAMRDTIDMTNHQSPNGYEDIKPTIKRSGNLTFDCNYIPADPSHAGATGLPAHFDAGTQVTVTLTMADTGSSVISFEAYVLGITPTNPVNGAGRISITMKPVGVIDWP